MYVCMYIFTSWRKKEKKEEVQEVQSCRRNYPKHSEVSKICYPFLLQILGCACMTLVLQAFDWPIRTKKSLPQTNAALTSPRPHLYELYVSMDDSNRQQSSSMATKRLSGLCTPFNKLYRRNVSASNAITQRMYATVDEGDTQVTHTGQVSCLSFAHYCFTWRKERG